jgi:hypothetical protein
MRDIYLFLCHYVFQGMDLLKQREKSMTALPSPPGKLTERFPHFLENPLHGSPRAEVKVASFPVPNANAHHTAAPRYQ